MKNRGSLVFQGSRFSFEILDNRLLGVYNESMKNRKKGQTLFIEPLPLRDFMKTDKRRRKCLTQKR